jgi:hypothetical protein
VLLGFFLSTGRTIVRYYFPVQVADTAKIKIEKSLFSKINNLAI